MLDNAAPLAGEETRYSVGTQNKGLKTGADGGLTIYVQAEPPAAQRVS